MEFIKWDSSLSMRMSDIDEQHKHFIGILNDVHEISNSKNSKSKKELNRVINDLIEYARIHFSTEENYFKIWNYPYAEEHMKEHEELILKVLKFKDKFDEKGIEVLDELIDFLKDWLENHLMNHDKKYSKYFLAKGYIK